jgi:hypothetical protein
MAIRIIAAVLAPVLAAPSPDHHDSHSSILDGSGPHVAVAALRVAIRVITTRNRSGGVSPLVVPPRLVAATVVAKHCVAAICPVAVDDPSIPCSVRGDFGGSAVGGLLSRRATVDPNPALARR